jgi:hypothetical protein
MFEQKRFAGRHLLTFESQKLNYFGKKGGPAFWHYNVIRIWAMSGPFSRFLVIFYPLSPRTPDDCKLNLYVSSRTYSIYVLGFINYDTYISWSCQWSLMSLITGNKVKKTHKPRYCEKEKNKTMVLLGFFKIWQTIYE